MSEVKHELCHGTYVKVAEVIQWTDPHTRKSMQHRVHFYREATTAEIMEAHPKCGECKHSDTHEHYGTTDCIVDQRYIRGVNKDKDYCRHWEAKG